MKNELKGYLELTADEENILDNTTSINAANMNSIITLLFKDALYKKIDNETASINDIFFFLNSFKVPIDMEYQILGLNNTFNEDDYEYMRKHNLSESQMKQLKMVYLLITEAEDSQVGGNE